MDVLKKVLDWVEESEKRQCLDPKKENICFCLENTLENKLLLEYIAQQGYGTLTKRPVNNNNSERIGLFVGNERIL